jgi:hypothetical protein
MLKFFIHYGCHIIVPIGIAMIYTPQTWKKTYFLLMLTMLVDIDHLWANAIFDPCRCSIGFHPLHSYYAIVIYFVALFYKPTRIVALGLVWHMMTDAIDCAMPC